MNWQAALQAALPFVPAFLLSISVHESAHALAALRLGDDTASRLGRISLYPPRHMELFGTVILPVISLWGLGIIYGYAKPTPVDPGKLGSPKRDFSLVALAGPLSNFLLALLSALAGRALMNAPGAASQALQAFCAASLTLNVLLGLVNALPLPGFDGIKTLYVFLPDAWCWRISRAERLAVFYLALLSLVGATGWLWNLARILLGLVSALTGFPA